jgi:hypothetical protein
MALSRPSELMGLAAIGRRRREPGRRTRTTARGHFRHPVREQRTLKAAVLLLAHGAVVVVATG